MTNEQLDMLIGSLLGDGYLVFGSSASKNAMYKLKQRKSNESYVHYVYDHLKGYVSCKVRYLKSRKPSRKNGKVDHSIENWNGEYCEHAYFWSRCDPVFTDLRSEWYPNGKKKIPSNLKLNSRRIAHWYVEDGSNNVTKDSKGAFLYTNGFSEEDVDVLISALDQLGLEAKMYAGPVIRIMSGSYFDFIKMVKPHVKKFGCFDYKIDISKAPSDRKGKGWKGPKLNLAKANQMRQMHSGGAKLKEIAAEYDVAISTVGKIVNHQMYPPVPVPRFTGQASVKMGVRY